MFEKIVKISILYDYYGELLNDKQSSIIELYYNQDLSLSEISEIIGISRQGIYDVLKRAENKLYKYESKLKLVEKFSKYSKASEKILEYTSKVNADNYKEIISDIEIEAKRILQEGWDGDNAI